MMLLILVLTLGCTGPIEASLNGSDCEPNSTPWLVSVAGCSGALINEWWVLTVFTCQVTPNETVVYLGRYDWAEDEASEQQILADRAVEHEPYRSPIHNLQLVRLAEPARLNSHVRPIPLPTRCPEPGEECTVSGWGSTDPDEDYYPGVPQCLVQPVIDDEKCLEAYPMLWSPYLFCAGYTHTNSTAGTCLRDTGSPMVCRGELQGLLSWGLGCSEPGLPETYTRVCSYLRWIKDVMNGME